jgi:hypothetical protein
MNNGLDNLGQVKSTLIDLAIHFGPKLLTAILILTIGSFVAGSRPCNRGVVLLGYM